MTKVPEAAKPFLQRFLDLTRDEPWIFGLPLRGEREYLAEFGLELREAFVIGGEESINRYLTRADGSQIGAAMKRWAARPPGATPAAPQMTPEQMREQQRVMAYQLAEAVVA